MINRRDFLNGVLATGTTWPPQHFLQQQSKHCPRVLSLLEKERLRPRPAKLHLSSIFDTHR